MGTGTSESGHIRANETSYGLVGCWVGHGKEMGMAGGMLGWLVGCYVG